MEKHNAAIPARLRILLAASDSGPNTLRALAESSGLVPSAVAVSCAAMGNLDLMRVRHEPGWDRDLWEYTLTDGGRAVRTLLLGAYGIEIDLGGGARMTCSGFGRLAEHYKARAAASMSQALSARVHKDRRYHEGRCSVFEEIARDMDRAKPWAGE